MTPEAIIARTNAIPDDEIAVEDMEHYIEEVNDALIPEQDNDPDLWHIPIDEGLEFGLDHKNVSNVTETWYYPNVPYIVPVSLRGIVNAVKYVESQNLKLRAIGSRHSYSEMVKPADCLLDLCRVDRISKTKFGPGSPLDQKALGLLRADLDVKKYFEAPAGMIIHEINEHLCPPNADEHTCQKHRRMFNMGGGDVQTIAGAFSTGTHGSGGRYSAYHDMIRSIVLVAAGGEVYRVEPSKGITDPFKHEGYYSANPGIKVTLIQDDDLFYSLAVSMGCFGIIYSVIMEVTEMELLFEQATFHRAGWDSIKEGLDTSILPDVDGHEKFVYITVNPYKLKRKNCSSVLVKETVVAAGGIHYNKRARRRNIFPSIFANCRWLTSRIRNFLNDPNGIKRRMIETSLSSLNDNLQSGGGGYRDLCYRVWNAGTGSLKTIGTGIEFALPVEEVGDALDGILDLLKQTEIDKNGYYLNAPIALRFVRPSRCYLAPNYYIHQGKEVKLWCYVEILRVNSLNVEDDHREKELYQFIHERAAILKARPHWGLNFEFPFTDGFLDRLYPEYNKWKKAFRYFNPRGTFSNAFTDRLDLHA